MEIKNYFSKVTKGVIAALVISILLTAILSLAMNFFTLGDRLYNVIYVIITCIALVIGSIMAAKSFGKRGWLVGLSVGLFTYIALYLIGIIFGLEANFGIYELQKLGISVVVGILSGMIGINLGN